MKELTIREKITEFELDMIDSLFETNMPESLKLALKKYAGVGIIESKYVDPFKQLDWSFDQFNKFDEIYALAKEFKDNGWGEKISFGHDPGGWHYCVDMTNSDFGKVYLNRWSDFDKNDQFICLANNFEEFINGLHRP